ncbi:MAG TPA: DUF3631 domain-containing protein [Methylomirabilota bacterium]|nr:DUF3631 domain-containing protein [Methylomirabilota bacterium]
MTTYSDTERAVLSSVLEADGEQLPEPITRLLADAPATFDDLRLGTIAVAIRDLRKAGQAVDPVSVKNHIGEEALLTIGGWEFLAGLTADWLPMTQAAADAKTLLAAYDRRKERDALRERLAAVEAEIGPEKAVESEEEKIARLAALPILEYARVRKVEAKKLGGIPAGLLDKLVDAKRAESGGGDGLQGSAVTLPEIEPWPGNVNGAEVLDQVAASLARYVALPDGAADAIALWCAHTHCYQHFTCTPRLNVTSPEKGCGKTTLRDVLATLVPRPVLAENLTVAVAFRLVQSHRPTVLADECDSWLRDNEDLRGLLNAGHRRGGQFLRCEGDAHEVRAFRVFAPAVLCGIGSLPGTLHDRSIVIRLERAKPGEVRERFDPRSTGEDTELCRKLARWCADHTARLHACDPALPPGVFNRVADNWRPLFAIAETLGGVWPERAATAFTKLIRADVDQEGLGVMLLADIRVVFEQAGADRLFSRTLVGSLVAMTDRPWGECQRGKPISERWLAVRLKGFGVGTRTIHSGGDHAKGYLICEFEEAFGRYLPDTGENKRANVRTPANKGDDADSQACAPSDPARLQNGVSVNNDGAPHACTLAKPGDGKKATQEDLL